MLLVVSFTAAASEVDFKVGNCDAGDDYGPLGTVALLRKKDTVTAEDFSTYWRDVHGLLAARIPGFWRYTQYHLADPLIELGSPVSDSLARVRPLQGIAEVSYCNETDIAGLAASPVAELIKHDERNVFSGSYLYAVAGGDGGSLLEPKSTPTAATKLGGTLLLVIAKAPSESRLAFKQSIISKGKLMVAHCPSIEKLRVNVVQPYQHDAWPAPAVDHSATPGLNALLELQFPSHQAAVSCLQSQAFFTTPAKRVVTVYPATQRYTLVADGRPTQLGLRGLPAYQLIDQLGAGNQQQSAVLNVLYGEK